MAPPIKIEWKLTGFKELQAKLDQLGADVSRKVVQPVLGDWGEETADAFFEAAPKETGFLREHFKWARAKMFSGKYGVIAGTVRVGPTNAVYPLKTKNVNGQEIQPKRGHKRTAQMVASWIEFGTARKAANPFMRGTMIKKGDYLIAKLGQLLKDALGL
jgi:HK97 gp10 family phage protein